MVGSNLMMGSGWCWVQTGCGLRLVVDFDCLWAPDGGGLGWVVDSIHLGALSVPSRHDSLGSKHQASWWIGITCPVLSVPSIKHQASW